MCDSYNMILLCTRYKPPRTKFYAKTSRWSIRSMLALTCLNSEESYHNSKEFNNYNCNNLQGLYLYCLRLCYSLYLNFLFLYSSYLEYFIFVEIIYYLMHWILHFKSFIHRHFAKRKNNQKSFQKNQLLWTACSTFFSKGKNKEESI